MLTFNLKKEWFEKIKSGEKTHEYRLQNKYWISRIKNFIGWNNIKIMLDNAINNGVYFECKIPVNTPYSRVCCFTCGYPPKDDKEKKLYGFITKISTNINGKETDLKIDKPMFDIEFELIKE